MKVLGIDPGTGRLGWAIIEKKNNKENMIECGCFETKANSDQADRLVKIFDFLIELIGKHKPSVASVENLFFATNAKTVMAVSESRGVILLACKKAGLDVFNYTPLQIKSALTGYGKADKKQVQYMVVQILKLKETPQPDDAADAVAAGLTHLFHSHSGVTIKAWLDFFRVKLSHLN